MARSTVIMGRSLAKVASAILIVLVWWLLALTLSPDVLPGPLPTFRVFWNNLITGQLHTHFFATMIRVGLGFLFAMLLGILAGTIMGLYQRVELVADLWVMVALTIPGLCYTFLSFMWFGLNEAAAIIAISITVFPSITINMWEGVKDIDSRLIDMSKTFQASPLRRFFQVIIPQILPYILAASRFGLGLIWKVTVLIELIGMGDGVGYMLNFWFQVYDMRQVLAWTLFFTIIMLVIELGILKQVENRIFAWRPRIKV